MPSKSERGGKGRKLFLFGDDINFNIWIGKLQLSLKLKRNNRPIKYLPPEKVIFIISG